MSLKSEISKSKTSFTHFNESGRARMVDISSKNITTRTACAGATVLVNQETMNAIKNGGIKKGDVLAVAQVAGIMAAKDTSHIIPMTHNLLLQSVDIEYEMEDSEELCKINIKSYVKCEGQTGSEMEALTAASVCALTIYDMCKSIQKNISISDIHLISKTGGKSGNYIYEK